MKKPDFIGVGFPKCATSFIYKLLCEHPQVEKFRKEIHYFSKPLYKFTEKDYNDYYNLFPTTNKKVGEFSPGTLYYPMTSLWLSKIDTKFIVIVRNPIDRTLSHIKQMNQFRIPHVKPKNESLFYKQSIYPEAIYTSNYLGILNNFFNYVNRKNVIIMQYEKLCLNLDLEMNNLLSFLNLKPYSYSNKIIRKQTVYPKKEKELLIDYFKPQVKNIQKKYPEINTFLWRDFS